MENKSYKKIFKVELDKSSNKELSPNFIKTIKKSNIFINTHYEEGYPLTVRYFV